MSQRFNFKNIFKGIVFDVNRYDVEVKGKLYPREIVENNGGVCILAIKDQQILLVEQYRPAVDAYTLEIPAGKIESNEDIKDCALRELEEESGYTCDELTKIHTIYSTPGFCGEVLHLFLAKSLHKLDNPRAMDEDEEITLHWIDLKEAIKLCNDQQIKDSKTIIAIQYALLELNN